MTTRTTDPGDVARGTIIERAPPKVNLTLSVLGRRPSDGYHELESLVAFATDIADLVTFEPGPNVGVSTCGPFGGSIAGENLLDVTLRRIGEAAPGIRLGHVCLDKRMPIAAGIGGGSADAAALIRAVVAANPGVPTATDWTAVAARIGADVPVCLASRAQVMRGIGERLEPMADLPPLAAVLVNPMVLVPADKTARVFRTLAAGALSAPAPTRRTPLRFDTHADLVAHMRAVGNDLTRSAREVVPHIADVLAALQAEPGCALAQLSGGGPTCFGIFLDLAAATSAADDLRAAHTTWWIAPSRLV